MTLHSTTKGENNMHYNEPELLIEIISYQPEMPSRPHDLDPGEDEEFSFACYLLGHELCLDCQSEELKDAIHDMALEQARQEHEENKLSHAANMRGIDL